MSSMEVPEPKDKVAERTDKLAKEKGADAAYFAASFLQTHVQSGLVSRQVAGAIAEAESQAAIEKFTRERNLGLHNDEESSTPGLVAILREGTKESFEHQMDIREIPIDSPLAPKFEKIDTSEDVVLYKMTLPKAIYDAYATNKIIFKLRAEPGINYQEPYLGANTWNIVRIEGAGGELWQNHEYNADGTLRS